MRLLPSRFGKRSALIAALVVAMAGLAATAAGAWADADVSHVGSTVTLQVRPQTGPDGNHEFGIQASRDDLTKPGEDISFNNTPFRPGIFTGTAVCCGAIQCNGNIFGTGVDCPHVVGAPSSVNVNLGDGNDTVFVTRDNVPVPIAGCDITSTDAIQMTVNLGPGDDEFQFPNRWVTVEPDCIPDSTLGPLTLNGGDGNDRISTDNVSGDVNVGPATIGGGGGNDLIIGTLLGDTIDGGSGDDQLFAGPGNDLLQGGAGNDHLEGDPGNDNLVGGTGNDTLNGGTGNDGFHMSSTDGSDGADTISGGPGFDTVDYSPRTCPLTITIGDGAANDGCAGEHDNVVDTEQLFGGSAGDHITGSDAPETIDGGPGNDVIDGGGGSDVLRGGGDADTIFAIDGVQDTVSCGPGSDVAAIDLTDRLMLTPVTVTLLGRPITVNVPDCESVTRQAVDDSRPGRPLRRPVRLGSRAAAVKFRCPATSRPACRGRLLLSDLYRPKHTLGASRYALRLGTTATIRVALTRAALAELRRSRHLLVRTVEHGHSRKGPRSAEFQLRATG